tara:strand:+ start:94 stop:624 length:531 start_codon:yes stop_codon:yes gene_type:complete
MPKRRASKVFQLLLLTWFSLAPAIGQAADPTKVKAAFLYNFVKFIHWPQTNETSNEFKLCIYGEPALFELMQKIPAKSIRGQALLILDIQQPTLLQQCQLVYMRTQNYTATQFILDNLSAHPILTVSDVDTFAKSGGMIEFKQKEQKLRFEINNSAAELAGLRISSKLLELALEVY